MILIKLQSNFIEITLRHGCCPVNFLYIFRTPFLKNTSEQLLVNLVPVDATVKRRVLPIIVLPLVGSSSSFRRFGTSSSAMH